MSRLVKILLNPISYILLSALFLSSCSVKFDNNEAVIKAMEESLENSNRSLKINSALTIRSIEQKTQDYITKERASIWFPKASQVEKFYSEMLNYIDEFKKLKSVNFEQAQELFIRLEKYKEDVLSVDSSIRMEFINNVSNILKFNTASGNGKKEFYATFFKNSSPALTSAILTKFQTDVAFIENRITLFCHEMIGSTDGCGFVNSFSAIVGQSSSYVRAGEVLEINAGVGSFSKTAKPEISVNGIPVNLNDYGFASKKITARKFPGKYIVPVSIKFTNTDGKLEEHQINVEYTVAKECDQ